MGRIGRTYPRAGTSAEVRIVKGRVLFLSRAEAMRHYLRLAKPLVWLCVAIGVVGASIAVGI